MAVGILFADDSLPLPLYRVANLLAVPNTDAVCVLVSLPLPLSAQQLDQLEQLEVGRLVPSWSESARTGCKTST